MRLFIAATFPAEVLRDLDSRVAHVKTKMPPASWVRPETQHLTLAFLGEQDESLVAKLSEPLGERLQAHTRFPGELRSCGFFPNPRRARVAWIGVAPEEKFVEVANAVREVVAKSGVVLDGAAFKPHLTLCRMRDPWPPACIDIFHNAFREYASAAFPVERVTLFSSRLNPSGAVHTPLREFALGGVAAAV